MRAALVGIALGTLLPGIAPGAAAAGCAASHRDLYARVVLVDDPVVFYRLDEPSGPTICDRSRSDDNGTNFSEGITYRAPGALKGSTDTAIIADGTSGVVGQSDSDSGITGNHSFTLEAWFQSTDTRNHVLVDIGQTCSAEVARQACGSSGPVSGQAAGIGLWPSGNHGCSSGFGVDEFGHDNCWDPTSVGVHLWNGAWHLLVTSYDSRADVLSAYVDGRGLGRQAPGDMFGAVHFHLAASRIALGQWFNTFNEPLVGGLDEVAVYRRALSPARITAHFEAARGLLCAVPRLVGESLGQAQRALARAHCALGKVTRSRSRGAIGTVLSQQPRGGEHLLTGSVVSLVVSKR